MTTRHARLIRCGILAARDPELSQYVHLAPRLVRKAARREAERMEDRMEVARRKAERAAILKLLTPTGDPAIDAANRAKFAGITYSFPQRFVVGANQDVPIEPEQAEHIRRFYA